MAGNHSGDDLATLSELDERLILKSLNKRYEQDLIYVSIGCVSSSRTIYFCKQAFLALPPLLGLAAHVVRIKIEEGGPP